MKRLVLLVACLLFGGFSQLAAATQTFIAVNVRDAESTAAWYARTFQLQELKRFDDPRYVIRILGRADLVVELVQLRPEPPAPPEKHLGIFKAGLAIDEFDATLERWVKDGVRFFGDGAPRVFFDRALGLHNTLLFDPEGNLLQVFGSSAKSPR